MIHKSPLPDVEIPDVLITEMVLQRATEHADEPALIDGPTGRTVTYGQLADAVQRFAGGLVARGFEPGDVVAIMAPNLPEYAVVFHGVAHAGGIVTTINPTYGESEVRHQIEDAKPRILVTVGPCLETVRAATAGTTIEDIYVIGDATDDVASVTDLLGDPLTEPVRVSVDATVVLPYSSGTTGLAKGVVLTHRMLVANLVQTLGAVELPDRPNVVAVLPMFHIYGMQVIMNLTLAIGGTLITMPRFDLEQFLQLHQEHEASISFVAPPIVLALAKHPLVDQYDLSALEWVMSGAAPLSADLAHEAATRLDCEVVQGYGMTELSPVSHVTPRGQFKPGSVGVTAPNTETKIVDPATGEAVGVGEDGEIWVRGPQVMQGYLNSPDATADTLDEDGWLHTGDIGHIDDDGHLYVVDRLKELIKYKGFQVPPAELEAVLLTHPGVVDAAVVGKPDDECGEIPVAFVVRAEACRDTEDDIAEHVAGQVASYKRLREVTFVDAVPKSPSGKILRRVLRDQL